jgi:hypothetical protein
MTQAPPSKELHDYLSEEEVLAALNRMANKAPGEDGIKRNDLLTIPCASIVSFFNTMLRDEAVPTTWERSILVPVSKPGKDPSLPSNLRGISLQQSLRKLFISCIATRWDTWITQKSILQRSQIGFRKGYRAIDNIFILRCLNERYLFNRKPLYVVYIDLKTAFDLTGRQLLWAQLRQHGAEGRLMAILRRLYRNPATALRPTFTLCHWESYKAILYPPYCLPSSWLS